MSIVYPYQSQSQKGMPGASGKPGNGIADVIKINTVGLVDTYRILFTNGTYTDYDVTNGNPHAGIGDMISSNNLSELTDESIARGNLGLGSLATQNGTFSGTSSGTNTGDNSPNTNSGLVHTTLDETIDGIKTFSSSPIVPTPTTGTQAANKTYADYTPDFYKYSISRTVDGSGNMNISLLNYLGATPSASAPVKYQDGSGTIRTISSALSVTFNAGTNYLNAGSTELATKEIDYFVYFQWNTTTSTTNLLGSRISHATFMSDITNSNTNEKGAMGIINYNSTDRVVNIGRFNATLSAGAGYTWSIPATSIIINNPIYETRILNYTPVFTGLTAQPTLDYAFYKIVGNLLFLDIRSQAGTSNSIAFTATSPFSANKSKATESCRVLDNGTWLVGGGSTEISTSSNIVNYYTGMNGGVFTASGSKATISKMNYYI